jgi:hypothetical protein
MIVIVCSVGLSRLSPDTCLPYHISVTIRQHTCAPQASCRAAAERERFSQRLDASAPLSQCLDASAPLMRSVLRASAAVIGVKRQLVGVLTRLLMT